MLVESPQESFCSSLSQCRICETVRKECEWNTDCHMRFYLCPLVTDTIQQSLPAVMETTKIPHPTNLKYLPFGLLTRKFVSLSSRKAIVTEED